MRLDQLVLILGTFVLAALGGFLDFCDPFWTVTDDGEIQAWCSDTGYGEHQMVTLELSSCFAYISPKIVPQTDGDISLTCTSCYNGLALEGGDTLGCWCNGQHKDLAWADIRIDDYIQYQDGNLVCPDPEHANIPPPHRHPPRKSVVAPREKEVQDNAWDHCTDFQITEDNLLYASCKSANADGHIWSDIALDRCFGNDNGLLIAQKDGALTGSCPGCKIVDGVLLSCDCQGSNTKSGNTHNYGWPLFDMTDIITVSSGRLCCFGSCGYNDGAPGNLPSH